MRLNCLFAPWTSSRSMMPEGLVWQSTLATASALLLILAFPPFDLHWLAWVALTPLLWALCDGITGGRAFWLGWLTGLLFTFFAENWIAHSMTFYGGMLTVVAYAVAFLFAAVLAIFPGLFAVVLARLLKRFGWTALVFAPLVWAATEWVRPFVTSVTWNALGVSQVREFTVARLAQYGGVYLLSALLVAGNALLVLLFKAKDRQGFRPASALLLFGAVCFWLPTLQGPDKPMPASVTVLGVQPNIPVDLPLDETKRYLMKTIALTETATVQAARQQPPKPVDLTIWAECPLSLFYENDPETQQLLNSLAQKTGSYFIINTVARAGENYSNSVNTISPRPEEMNPSAFKRYDKIRLVPFGEFVPWRPLLGRFVPAITGDFTAGKQAVVNTLRLSTERAAVTSSEADGNAGPAIERTTSFVRTGTFICYEAAYPDLVRQFVRNGATLLVNISEDGWFGNTAGARQHLAHAQMRAIENDRDLVRVTNTGISALLTAEGQVVNPLPQFTEGTQIWQAHTRSGQTFYTRYGDWFAGVAALVTLILLGFSFIPLQPEAAQTKH